MKRRRKRKCERRLNENEYLIKKTDEGRGLGRKIGREFRLERKKNDVAMDEGRKMNNEYLKEGERT